MPRWKEAPMIKVELEADLLPHLADILMAGAHADDQLDGREVEAVKAFLLSFIKDAESLPSDLEERIDGFDVDAFDLEYTVEAMGNLSMEQRRAVLEMLSALSEADEEIDLAEDEYLRAVAEAMGADAEDLNGLTVEIEFVESFHRAVPPPPPPVKK